MAATTRRLLRALAALAAAVLSWTALPAAADALPGEVMVKLRSGNDLPALLSRYQLSLLSRFGTRPIYRLAVPPGTTAEAAVAALSVDPAVLLAEVNRRQQAPEAGKNRVWAIGTPTLYAAQWAWGPLGLDLAAAHQRSQGQGVTVAVLDTGVDLQHPALAGRLRPGWDFVDGDANPSEAGYVLNPGFGHGTHVASIVAQVAPAARILPLRVLDADGIGHAWAIGEALLYAVDPDGNPATPDGAQVINLSLGSPDPTTMLALLAKIASCEPPDPAVPMEDQSDPGYNGDRERCAGQVGAVVVAAAGNGGSARERWYPAAEAVYGQLSVAATRSNGQIAEFSNRGPWIDLAAPGDAITGAVPGGWATWSGTSMAAPMVAGTAALVRSALPRLDAKTVARCLVRTASETPFSARVPTLNPARTMQMLGRGPCR